jgi:hypothetical protein
LADVTTTGSAEGGHGRSDTAGEKMGNMLPDSFVPFALGVAPGSGVTRNGTGANGMCGGWG